MRPDSIAGRQSSWAAVGPLCGRALARRRCAGQAHAAACGSLAGGVGLLRGRARRLCLGADCRAAAEQAATGSGIGGRGGRARRLPCAGSAAGRRAPPPGQALAAGARLLSSGARRLSLGADRSAPASEPATECGGAGGGGQRGGALPPPAGDDDDDYEDDGSCSSARWSPWQRCALSCVLIISGRVSWACDHHGTCHCGSTSPCTAGLSLFWCKHVQVVCSIFF